MARSRPKDHIVKVSVKGGLAMTGVELSLVATVIMLLGFALGFFANI
jgi:hypothetical protein